MAAENLLSLTTDVFHPDAIKALKDNLGIETFSGQSSATADLTGFGWLCVIAINTIKNPEVSYDEKDIKSVLKDIGDSKNSQGIALKDETNQKKDNLLMQLLMYYKDVEAVSLADIWDVLDYLEVDLEKQLSQLNSQEYSPAMVIAYTEKYHNDMVDIIANQGTDNDYAKPFYDVSYKDTGIVAGFPIARLILSYAQGTESAKTLLDKIVKIDKSPDDRYSEFENVFLPYTYSISENSDNSLEQAIYAIDASKIPDIKDAFTSCLTRVKGVSDDLSAIINSINFDSCVGLKVGETGFSLSSYKTNISSYEPKVDIMYYLLNKMGNQYSKDIDDIVSKYCTPYLFPYTDEVTPEGFTPVGIMASKLAIDSSTNEAWLEAPINKVVKKYLSKARVQVLNKLSDETNDLKKFFALNAVLGTVRDFTENSSMNMFSALNVVLDKINKAHKAWCTNNNKSFDDFKEKYNGLIKSIFVDDSQTSNDSDSSNSSSDNKDSSTDTSNDIGLLSFDTAYKYWCQEYDKMF